MDNTISVLIDRRHELGDVSRSRKCKRLVKWRKVTTFYVCPLGVGKNKMVFEGMNGQKYKGYNEKLKETFGSRDISGAMYV